MPKSRVVVDGSNIATEGRTLPSLAQLESAIEEIKGEYPKAEITVVVDATFAHRIDPSELHRFETGLAAGLFIIPPAGAIGRGDAFVLKIAEKSNAIVLSNDSFQEFHGEHAWLFDPDRLLGASPVPGVGWIFIPRTPVRGIKSRAAVRGVRNLPPMPKPTKPPPSRARKATGTKSTAESVALPLPQEESTPTMHVGNRVATSVAAVNDQTTFITFIASHPLGEFIDAEVESFTSHGAVVRYQDVQCYAPLAGLGTPPPRSPREVLKRGEIRTFVIRGLDPQRRGVELALPGPTEIAPPKKAKKVTAKRTAPKKVAKSGEPSIDATAVPPAAVKAPRKRLVAKKPAASKISETSKGKVSTPAKPAPAREATAKRAVPKRSAAAKQPAKKSSTKATASAPKRLGR
jgi:hypothetical protein